MWFFLVAKSPLWATDQEVLYRAKELSTLAKSYIGREFTLEENLYLIDIYKSKIAIKFSEMFEPNPKFNSRIIEDFVTGYEPITVTVVPVGTKITVKAIHTVGRSPATESKDYFIKLQLGTSNVDLILPEFEHFFIFQEKRKPNFKNVNFPRKISLCNSRKKNQFTKRDTIISEIDRKFEHLKKQNSNFKNIFETFVIGNETEANMEICYLANATDEKSFIEIYMNSTFNLKDTKLDMNEL